MQLTRAADYAVRVMIHMASLPSATTLRLKNIGNEVNVPESFLAKVLQILTRAGMITSKRGPDGGFTLPDSSRQLTILDIVTAVDGPVQLNSCLISHRPYAVCAFMAWVDLAGPRP
jgi:Rrf2 family protein